MGPLLILAAGLLAYVNSLGGAFVFDDHLRLLEDLSIRDPWRCWARSSRPLTQFTFFLNYVLGGLVAPDFRAANVAIHIGAALLLLGVVRRTLGLPGFLTDSLGSRREGLALSVALLWLAHPLQTESVTYVVQRSESLMGFFYLATTYAFLRAIDARSSSRKWFAGAVLFSALGMMCKPVMVTAPVMVLLLDGLFVAGSFRNALARRWGFHAAMISTAAIAVVLALHPNESASSAGFGARLAITPLTYLQTQPGVILHYLRLAFLPVSLCLDYAWLPASTWNEIVPQTAFVLGLLFLTMWLCRRRHPAGFLGIWFFLILLPTSSFVPIADCAVEHRMYLSLAAPVTLAVAATYAGVAWLCDKFAFRPITVAGASSLLAVCAMGACLTLTILRNRDYQSEKTMWSDIAAKRPGNYRAQSAVIGALLNEGAYAEAERKAGALIVVLRRAVGDTSVHSVNALIAADACPRVMDQLGRAVRAQGRPAEAITHFREALRANPLYTVARHNLALTLLDQGDLPGAALELETAIQSDPNVGLPHYLLGVVQEAQHRYAEASASYRKALLRKPDFMPAKLKLAWLSATAPDACDRNEAEALALAMEVCGATAFLSPRCLDVLAAAQAAMGRFQDAARIQEDAIKMVRGRQDLPAAGARSDEMQPGRSAFEANLPAMVDRLQLYQKQTAFRQNAPSRQP